MTDFGDNKCKHLIITETEGSSICQNCGLELSNRITNLPVNFYRDKNDGSISYDPTRYTIKSDFEKGIYKELSDLKVEHIYEINSVFNKVFVKNDKNQHQINRGDNRKSLIFACLEYVYEKYGLKFNKDEIIKKLEISRKDAAKGSRLLSLNFSKLGEKRLKVNSPLKKMNEYVTKLDKLKDNVDEHVENMNMIYETIKNKSIILNGSKPNSINCGLLYYYIKEYIDKDNDILQTDIEEIHKISGISIATINKIYIGIKEVVNKLNNKKKKISSKDSNDIIE